MVFSQLIFQLDTFWDMKIKLWWLLSGGYDKEDKAARAYDLAALKYWGPKATTNFPVRVTFLILCSDLH